MKWSSQIHTGFLVSSDTWEYNQIGIILFVYRTVTFCGLTFQIIRLRNHFVTYSTSLHPVTIASHNPGCAKHAGFNTQLGLGLFPFARRY